MLLKKMLRTFKLYKAQFISLIFMLTIGFGCFIGFNVEWKSLEVNLNDVIEKTGYSDYKIYQNGTNSFSIEDINKINKIEGVVAATRAFSLDLNKVKENEDEGDSSINLNVIESYGNPTKLYTVSGNEYDPSNNGLYLSDKYANAHNIKVGDYVSFKYNTTTFSIPVTALVKNGEYLINVQTNQLMPDYYAYGFAFITPQKLESIISLIPYNMIYLNSSLDKDELTSKLEKENISDYLLVSKVDDTDYSQTMSEIDEGKTMALILPLIFLLVALFTMVSTINRIVKNERSQIGILKSLGFRDSKIVLHYMSYGVFISLISLILAIILGYLVGYVVVNPNGMMSTYIDFISWKLYSPSFVYFVSILILFIICLTCYLSVKGITKENASETLKEAKPKTVKNSLLEKTKIWNHLGFVSKWNIRSFSRNKCRTILSILSASLAISIMFASLSFRDTELSYINMIKNDVIKYNSEISVDSNSSNDKIIELAEEVNGDYVYQNSINIENDEDVIMLNVYNSKNDLFGFVNQNGTPMILGNEGCYISLRIFNLGYQVGDYIEFKQYAKDTKYKVKIAGVILSTSSKMIVMTEEAAKIQSELDIFHSSISSIYTNLNKDDIEKLNSPYVSFIKTRSDILKSYDTMVSMMNLMIDILVGAAFVLGVFVLYNLGVMSYFERIREFGTLKILGFRDKKINRILYFENIIKTFIGFIIGIPVGYILTVLFVNVESSRYELVLNTKLKTYLIISVLSIFIGLFVSFLLSKKNNKLDLSICLKNRE